MENYNFKSQIRARRQPHSQPVVVLDTVVTEKSYYDNLAKEDETPKKSNMSFDDDLDDETPRNYIRSFEVVALGCFKKELPW